MKQWLTIKDLCEYLSIDENKVHHLIKQNAIPFYNSHGLLRFNREEIDNWMKNPSYGNYDKSNSVASMIYKNRPIYDYLLTASKILVGKKAFERISPFIKGAIEMARQKNREYLYREEFSPLIINFNDYLRLCCQLGLIEKRPDNNKRKSYYLTSYAERIFNGEDAKKVILESIFDIIRNNKETIPDERHAILLLWYYLALKTNGIKPTVEHFRKNSNELINYYPQMRFNFTKSFCEYLFNNDERREKDFFEKWNQYV